MMVYVYTNVCVHARARGFNITRIHKYGNIIIIRREDTVQLYHLYLSSFRINFTLYMYRVISINEFEINVLTRNHLCSCPTNQSYTNYSTRQIRKLSVQNIYNKQMLSIVCSGKV